MLQGVRTFLTDLSNVVTASVTVAADSANLAWQITSRFYEDPDRWSSVDIERALTSLKSKARGVYLDWLKLKFHFDLTVAELSAKSQPPVREWYLAWYSFLQSSLMFFYYGFADYLVPNYKLLVLTEPRSVLISTAVLHCIFYRRRYGPRGSSAPTDHRAEVSYLNEALNTFGYYLF